MSQTSSPASRVSAPQAARPANGGSGRTVGCSVVAVLMAVGTMFLCGGGVYVLATMNHYGQEFSPQTFERRSYEFGEFKPTGRQLWGITRTPIARTSFETYLVGQKLIPLKKQPDRWDVLWSAEIMPESHRDAAILTRTLDEIGPDGGYVWHRWSIDHPEMARALWPCVAALAEDYLYVFIPELLDLARNAEDANAFEQELTARMQAIYGELAEDERASGNTQVADRLADRAAFFGKPDWRELLFEGSVEPSAADVKASKKKPEIVIPQDDADESEDGEKRDETLPVEPEDDEDEKVEEKAEESKDDDAKPEEKIESDEADDKPEEKPEASDEAEGKEPVEGSETP